MKTIEIQMQKYATNTLNLYHMQHFFVKHFTVNEKPRFKIVEPMYMFCVSEYKVDSF